MTWIDTPLWDWYITKNRGIFGSLTFIPTILSYYKIKDKYATWISIFRPLLYTEMAWDLDLRTSVRVSHQRQSVNCRSKCLLLSETCSTWSQWCPLWNSNIPTSRPVPMYSKSFLFFSATILQNFTSFAYYSSDFSSDKELCHKHFLVSCDCTG